MNIKNKNKSIDKILELVNFQDHWSVNEMQFYSWNKQLEIFFKILYITASDITGYLETYILKDIKIFHTEI